MRHLVITIASHNHKFNDFRLFGWKYILFFCFVFRFKKSIQNSTSVILSINKLLNVAVRVGVRESKRPFRKNSPSILLLSLTYDQK